MPSWPQCWHTLSRSRTRSRASVHPMPYRLLYPPFQFGFCSPAVERLIFRRVSLDREVPCREREIFCRTSAGSSTPLCASAIRLRVSSENTRPSKVVEIFSFTSSVRSQPYMGWFSPRISRTGIPNRCIYSRIVLGETSHSSASSLCVNSSSQYLISSHQPLRYRFTISYRLFGSF